jgi:hypothetical protein
MYRIDEPIALLELRYNYQPRAFRWRGMTHAIYQVERRWAEVALPWRPAQRQYWRVRCQDGRRYDIYQDLRANTWHLAAIRAA